MKHKSISMVICAVLVASFALVAAPQPVLAVNCSGSNVWRTNAATGNWATNSTWQCDTGGGTWVTPNSGQYPGSGDANDAVTIQLGHKVTVDSAIPNAVASVTTTGPTTDNTINELILATGGTLDITGNLTITAGTGSSRRSYLQMQGGTLTVGGNLVYNAGNNNRAQVIFSGTGGTLNLKGNLTVPDSGQFFGGTAGTVNFNGTANQTVQRGDSNVANWFFFNMTVSNTSGTVTLGGIQRVNGNLTVDSGAILDLSTQSITVAGTVNNNGTMKQTVTVGTGAITALRIATPTSSTTYTYHGVEFQSGSGSMGSTVVSIRGNQTCNIYGYPIKRCYEITPTTTQTRNIRFYFQQSEMQSGQVLSEQNVWNFHGGSWNLVTRGGDSTTCGSGAINCYVQGNGISTYSPFQLAKNAPTAVTLASFEAQQISDFVQVSWETASEIDNRGFNLYRATSPDFADPGRIQLNEFLIPSQGQGSPGGFAYTWDDHADLVPGTSYYYWLEDLDVYDVTTLHGPVSVDFVAPTAVTLSSVSASPAAAAPGLAWLWVVAAAGAALGASRLRRRRA